MAVLMTEMRMGRGPVLMPNVLVGRAVGRQCVTAVMLTGRTMGDPRPRRLEREHGQQQQKDESFHGRGL
jgi:hypothetical protein